MKSIHTDDADISEETPLVVNDDRLKSDASNPDGNDSVPDSDDSKVLWEELEKPWPSTFERSVALLSSPVMNANEADLYTRSPYPGSTPAALQRRKDLRRGFFTPETTSFFGTGAYRSERENSFQQGVERIRSLDFTKNTLQLKEARVALQKKAKEAKEYREKLLRKTGHQVHVDDGKQSPGYERKAASMRANRKRTSNKPKPDDKVDGKTSFSQCIFNLANILMGVGLLGLPFALKSAGWLGGILALLAFALITWRTSILIGRELNGDPRPSAYFDDSPFKSPILPGSAPEARMFPPMNSFPDIAQHAFGYYGNLVLSVILYFELFSCISIFFVTIGDHLHTLFPDISARTHIFIVGGVSPLIHQIAFEPTF
jgi:hypothetical protein